MRVISATDIAALVDIGDIIEAVDAAMRRVSERAVELPLRQVMQIAPGKRLGMMPGVMSDPPAFGIKLLSLFADNPSRGLSSHTGVVLVFDMETGLPRACLEASVLTALRTSAASAVATRALTTGAIEKLAIIGTGEEAGAHLAAMRAVRSPRRVEVWGRDPAKAAAFAAAHSGVTVAASIAAALDGADLVCTTTSAREPLVQPGMLAPGAHLNAAGATRPPTIEIAPGCYGEVTLFTDYVPSLEAEAFDYIQARERNIIAPGTAVEIGAVLRGVHPGRKSSDERTMYRSLGVAAQDLASACLVLERAEKAGRGTVVDLQG
jgi:ornithine cyclodeaminase